MHIFGVSPIQTAQQIYSALSNTKNVYNSASLADVELNPDVVVSESLLQRILSAASRNLWPKQRAKQLQLQLHYFSTDRSLRLLQ